MRAANRLEHTLGTNLLAGFLRRRHGARVLPPPLREIGSGTAGPVMASTAEIAVWAQGFLANFAMYQSTSFHTVPPPGAQNSVPREAPLCPARRSHVHTPEVGPAAAGLAGLSRWRPRPGCCCAPTNPSMRRRSRPRASAAWPWPVCWTRSRARPASTRCWRPWAPLLDSGWPGFLVDSTGRALPAGPGAAAHLPALPADFSERLAASLAQAAPGVSSAGQGAEQSAGQGAGQGASQGWLGCHQGGCCGPSSASPPRAGPG